MNKSVFLVAVLGAFALGVGSQFFWPTDSASPEPSDSGDAQDKPLYWVAPMDDSYRRDEPGQSPMGMDLVPVYADDQKSEPGDVRIDPAVAQNLGLTLAEVSKAPIGQTIHTVGLVEVNQQQVQHFHVRASGWITELAVATEGDPVQAGEKLFEFYSPEIVNLQKEYLQSLRDNLPGRADGSLSQMRAKGVSEREIERLKRERSVREKLHYYASRDGYVVQLGVREGNFVDLAQNLMSIGSLDNIWVNVELFESDAARVDVGQPVRLTTDSSPGESWDGTVSYLYPSLNTDTRTLRARLEFPNDDGQLKPGMFVSARLEPQGEQDVLSIPRSALIRTGSGTRVVREIDKETYRSVPVKTGRISADRAEVLEGLEAGDRVVEDGLFLIDSESSRDADLSRLESRPASDEEGHESMDHSEMDHGEMNHGDMDHSEMNHDEMDHGEMNHSDMDHSEMNHDEMDHGEMDHSDMDHSEMNHDDMDHGSDDQNHGGHSQ